MLARERLERIILHSQQAIELLNQGNKRRVVGLIDEIEDDSEAAKWLLINEINEEKKV